MFVLHVSADIYWAGALGSYYIYPHASSNTMLVVFLYPPFFLPTTISSS